MLYFSKSLTRRKLRISGQDDCKLFSISQDFFQHFLYGNHKIKLFVNHYAPLNCSDSKIRLHQDFTKGKWFNKKQDDFKIRLLQLEFSLRRQLFFRKCSNEVIDQFRSRQFYQLLWENFNAVPRALN